MELRINNIESLLAKKVPKHGKISGVKNKGGVVRVIVPNEYTKLSLIVIEPSEVLSRTVTPDGKVLGLTNYIEKMIYIIDQDTEDLCKEAGLTKVTDAISDEQMEEIYEICETQNIDPMEFCNKAIQAKLKTSQKEELNE